MGHGLGPAQRAMLDELTARLEGEEGWWAREIKDLATELKLTERRTRTVARSLEARGLVYISKEHLGWRGVGEYGNLEKRQMLRVSPVGEPPVLEPRFPDVPVALRLKKGDRWPYRWARGYDPVDHKTWTATRDVEFVKAGVPASGLLVWLPEGRRRYVAREIAETNKGRAMFRNPPMTDARILERFGPVYGADYLERRKTITDA